MGLASLGNDLKARTPPKLPEPARPVSTSEERLRSLCITVAGVPQPSPPRGGPPKPALIIKKDTLSERRATELEAGKTPAEAVGYHRLVMLVATPFRRSHEARPSRSHAHEDPKSSMRHRVHPRAQLVAMRGQRLSATTFPARARAHTAGRPPACGSVSSCTPSSSPSSSSRLARPRFCRRRACDR